MFKPPKKKDKETLEPRKLTPEELEELKRTENEVEIKKKQFICVVHKGYVEGEIYLCPICHTFYCEKCAKALKLKGDRCWSCDSKLTVSITIESEYSEESLTSALEDADTREMPEKNQRKIEELRHKIAKAEEALDKGDLKDALKKYENAIVLALKSGEEGIAKGLTGKMHDLRKMLLDAKDEKKKYKMEHEVELKVFKASVKSVKKLLKEPKEKKEDITNRILKMSAEIVKDAQKKKEKLD